MQSTINPQNMVTNHMGSKTHPGFKAVQNSIAARQGISQASAAAILASSTRNASAKAKKKNPKLKKVE